MTAARFTTVLASASLSMLLGVGCASAVCGYTTASSSSITGSISYDGVATSVSNTDVSAFERNLDANWSVGPKVGADDESLKIDFKGAPLAEGSFSLEAQGARLCHDYVSGPYCEPATGTIVVTKFVIDPCGTGEKIGCPTHLEADVNGTAMRSGQSIDLHVHLHVDGKRVPYEGCIGDRLGK